MRLIGYYDVRIQFVTGDIDDTDSWADCEAAVMRDVHLAEDILHDHNIIFRFEDRPSFHGPRFTAVEGRISIDAYQEHPELKELLR